MVEIKGIRYYLQKKCESCYDCCDCDRKGNIRDADVTKIMENIPYRYVLALLRKGLILTGEEK